MKTNDLMCKENDLIRILKLEPDKALVIDCNTFHMPEFISMDELKQYSPADESKIHRLIDVFSEDKPNSDKAESVSTEKKKMVERYGMIASVIPVIDNNPERNAMIELMALRYKVTKQTIRTYLCRYLVYQDIRCLGNIKKEKNLSDDEENYRAILNKYFYTQSKRTLHTCYLYLLRDKYTDKDGNLMEEHPTERQFNYFYYKTRKMQNVIISRMGRSQYDRDFRPLLGISIEHFNRVGFGEVDSTIADIYLVNENNEVIGRPVITAMVCPYSQLLLGYTVGFNNDTLSLRDLMINVIEDKVSYAQKCGIVFNENDFPVHFIPCDIITDRGAEYLSQEYSNLTDLGIRITNLAAYSPDKKGVVEKFFDVIQDYFKQYLMNNGVIRDDYAIRGAPDYRLAATLTLDKFNKILLHCIRHYNTKRVIESMDHSLFSKVRPFANEIFLHSYKENENAFVSISKDELIKIMLPRTMGHFERNGLIVNAAIEIMAGVSNNVVAGGIEFMSDVPYAIRDMRNGHKLGPTNIDDLIVSDGLTDIFSGKHMGITAENIAEKFHIMRKLQDEYALRSQTLAVKAIDEYAFQNEITPITINQKGKELLFDTDESPRRDTDFDKLSKLKPAFKADGTVTAGNSSGVNDGISFMLLSNDQSVKENNLHAIGELVYTEVPMHEVNI